MPAVNNIPAWMGIAFGRIGQVELPGPNSNNPWIVDCLKSVKINGTDEVPWCAASMNWILAQVGIKGTGLANARSYLSWGKKLDKPVLGCVTVLKQGMDWQGHVGFFLDGYNSRIYLLGGNQSDRYGIISFSSDSLLDYRWPI